MDRELLISSLVVVFVLGWCTGSAFRIARTFFNSLGS